MSGSGLITRRGFIGGALLAGLGGKALGAGLCRARRNRRRICAVVPGKTFVISRRSRPASGISHRMVVRDRQSRRQPAARPMARNGRCFVRRSRPGAPAGRLGQPADLDGPCRGDPRRHPSLAQTFARGGVGQAGVEANPFHAWIDAWEMRGLEPMNDDNIAPLELKASGADFSYALRLDADRPLVLQGDGGYSRKSLREQASYYYSQPHYHGEGQHHHRRQAGRRDRTGLARPRVEQPAAGLGSERMGLALAAFQERRKADAVPDAPDRRPALRLGQMDRARRQGRTARFRRHQHDAAGIHRDRGTQDPDLMAHRHSEDWRWRSTARRSMPKSWMGTSFPYWEGPISFGGSHSGLGYLEMTGY